MAGEQPEMTGENQPFQLPSSAGVVYWGPGVVLTFLATGKDTNGAHTQVENEVAPGAGLPPHIHQHEDETWYVDEGSLQFRIGESTWVARTGDYIEGPRGTVHSFRNVGECTARVLTTFVPAGIEHFFMEVFQPDAGPSAPPSSPSTDLIKRMTQAAPRYGIELLLTPESEADTKRGFDALADAPGLQH